MTLPFLPAEHIAPAFDAMVHSLPVDDNECIASLVQLAMSVRHGSKVSCGQPTPSWLAFQLSVRTNNDMEGWHNRLNLKTQSRKLDMYQLVPLLHREALFIDVQVTLVHEHRQALPAADLPECTWSLA